MESPVNGKGGSRLSLDTVAVIAALGLALAIKLGIFAAVPW